MSKLATPQFWQTMVARKNMVRKKDATFVANFGKKMSIMCRAGQDAKESMACCSYSTEPNTCLKNYDMPNLRHDKSWS